MVQPFNYITSANAPGAGLQSGLAAGLGIYQAGEQQRRAEEAGMRAAAGEMRAQEAHDLKVAAARQQQQRQQEFMSMLGALASKGASATSDDFYGVLGAFPEYGESLSETWGAMTDERKRGVTTRLLQVGSAIKSGNFDLAEELANEYADAAENSNDMASAATARGMIDVMRQSPDAALSSLGMTLFSVDPKAAALLFPEAPAELPASIQALEYRARAAGLEPGSEAYREFMVQGGAKQGMAIEMGADGTVRFAQGDISDDIFGGKPPTEGQLASAGYLQRMQKAEEVISELEAQGSATVPTLKSYAVGTRFEGRALNETEERLVQARRDWVRAKLRKESGAVIGDEEMLEEVRTYFPLPGEGPETIRQKAEARKNAERQFQITSGPARELAEEQEPEARAPEVQAVLDQYKGGIIESATDEEILEVGRIMTKFNAVGRITPEEAATLARLRKAAAP